MDSCADFVVVGKVSWVMGRYVNSRQSICLMMWITYPVETSSPSAISFDLISSLRNFLVAQRDRSSFRISSVVLVGLDHLMQPFRMADNQLKTTIFIDDLAGLSE